MKKIIEIFVLLVLIGFGFTFCVKDDQALEELGTSVNIVFPPLPPPNPPEVDGKVFDLDGNLYNTVEIGNQTWMAENLKTTRYNDGTLIPNETALSGLSTPGYCWYDNNESRYRSDYGAIYNGYAVKTGKLCPTGWHVPDLSEWKELIAYLGGWEVAASKLKESGTSHWDIPNAGATNESGFKALGGGRYCDIYYPYVKSGTYIICTPYYPFHSIGRYSEWWSSTRDDYTPLYNYNALLILGLESSYERVWGLDTPGHYYPDKECGREMFNGCYVRCIRDN